MQKRAYIRLTEKEKLDLAISMERSMRNQPAWDQEEMFRYAKNALPVEKQGLTLRALKAKPWWRLIASEAKTKVDLEQKNIEVNEDSVHPLLALNKAETLHSRVTSLVVSMEAVQDEVRTATKVSETNSGILTNIWDLLSESRDITKALRKDVEDMRLENLALREALETHGFEVDLKISSSPKKEVEKMSSAPLSKTKVMIVGMYTGHNKQMLIEQFGDRFEFEFVEADKQRTLTNRTKIDGHVIMTRWATKSTCEAVEGKVDNKSKLHVCSAGGFEKIVDTLRTLH